MVDSVRYAVWRRRASSVAAAHLSRAASGGPCFRAWLYAATACLYSPAAKWPFPAEEVERETFAMAGFAGAGAGTPVCAEHLIAAAPFSRRAVIASSVMLNCVQ